MFSCEFCEIFKNTFFIDHLRWLLLYFEKQFFYLELLLLWVSRDREFQKHKFSLNWKEMWLNLVDGHNNTKKVRYKLFSIPLRHVSKKMSALHAPCFSFVPEAAWRGGGGGVHPLLTSNSPHGMKLKLTPNIPFNKRLQSMTLSF